MICSQAQIHGAFSFTCVAKDEPHVSIQFNRSEIEGFHGEPDGAKLEISSAPNGQAREHRAHASVATRLFHEDQVLAVPFGVIRNETRVTHDDSLFPGKEVFAGFKKL